MAPDALVMFVADVDVPVNALSVPITAPPTIDSDKSALIDEAKGPLMAIDAEYDGTLIGAEKARAVHVHFTFIFPVVPPSSSVLFFVCIL